MGPSTRHPLVDRYLADLRREAQRLPRRQRAELVAEIEAHLADGLREDSGEAAVRNLLDDLGTPQDIVDAGAPPSTTGRSQRAAVGLALGVVGVLAALIPVLGLFVAIPLGGAAVVLGVQARRHSRRLGASTAMATGAVVTGFVAVIAPLAAMAAFLAVGVVTEEGGGVSVEAVPADEVEADIPATPAS